MASNQMQSNVYALLYVEMMDLDTYLLVSSPSDPPVINFPYVVYS